MSSVGQSQNLLRAETGERPGKDYRLFGKRCLLGTYVDRGLTIVGGEGVYLIDDRGERYLDLATNYGVNIFGYGHAELVRRLKAQIEKLPNLHGSFHNDRRSLAAEALVKRCGGERARVFFSSSGTEAVEAALKFAALVTGKKKFVACLGGYHGKTLGSLSATHGPQFRKPFEPLLWDFEHVAYGALEPLEKALADETAAFIVEPVQGEGGVVVPAAGYLAEAWRLCRSRNALMILDEVQTGVGRTGRFLASEEECRGFDILCLGKGLAGGIPIGATLVAERIAAKIPRSSHTSTFGGNPLAAEGILATLELLSEETLASIRRSGDLFLDSLRRVQTGENVSRLAGGSRSLLASNIVVEVRGKGLMIGLEVSAGRDVILKELQRRKILALPAADNVVRFLPPYVLEEKHLLGAMKTLGAILDFSQDAARVGREGRRPGAGE